MKSKLQQIFQKIIYEKWGIKISPKIEIPPDLSHGDYTTNIAMLLAKELKKNPIEIAKELVESIKHQASSIKHRTHYHSTDQSHQNNTDSEADFSVLQDITKIEVAPPGFINVFLSASNLSTELAEVLKAKNLVATTKSSSFVIASEAKQSQGRLPHPVLTGFAMTGNKIMVEFAHPNTHKAFHIGHLRNITTGECIVRLLESQGAKVIRANYQGDVGMHIAKCLYGILDNPEIKKQVEKWCSPNVIPAEAGILINKIPGQAGNDNKSIKQKVELLGKAYAAGSKAYETEEQAKKEIEKINKQIYAGLSHAEFNSASDLKNEIPKQVRDDNVDIIHLYRQTRQWSLGYFENIYKRLGSYFDRYYFESEVYGSGKKNVEDGLKKGIFVKSDSAVIFPGEKFGLHNRVFITSEGNPTYEGKDMGLGPLQFEEYRPNLIIHVVGPEQAGYFQVVFEALAQLFPTTRGKEYHLIYGWVKLKHGKMSSRTGNVVLGEWLLDEAKKEIYNILQRSESKDVIKTSDNKTCLRRQALRPTSLQDKSVIASGAKQSSSGNDNLDKDTIAETAAVAAVKYSFLKVSTKQEIAFDIDESINFQGDSGPYLLYTYARCKSVLRKAGHSVILEGAQNTRATDRISSNSSKTQSDSIARPDIRRDSLQNDKIYNNEELSVLRLIRQFPEKVAEAAQNFAPNILCKYLYDLAGGFNTFYNKHSILGSIGVSEYQSIGGKKSSTRDTSTLDTIQFRLALTAATARIIQNGLFLLGINTLERM